MTDRELPVDFCTQTGPTSTSSPSPIPRLARLPVRTQAAPARRPLPTEPISPGVHPRLSALTTPTMRPLARWIYPFKLNSSIPCRQPNTSQRLESAAPRPYGSWPPFGVEQPSEFAPTLGVPSSTSARTYAEEQTTEILSTQKNAPRASQLPASPTAPLSLLQRPGFPAHRFRPDAFFARLWKRADTRPSTNSASSVCRGQRSEERRVGQDCRSRCSPYH